MKTAGTVVAGSALALYLLASVVIVGAWSAYRKQRMRLSGRTTVL